MVHNLPEICSSKWLALVGEIQNPLERLNVLHNAVAFHVSQKGGNREVTAAFPLGEVLDLTAETLLEARRRLPTAEAAYLQRAGVEHLVGYLCLSVFAELERSRGPSDEEGASAWLVRPQNGSEYRQAAALFRVLESGAHWILGRYQEEPFPYALQRSHDAHGKRFRQLCDELAKRMADDDLDADSHSEIISELRRIRARVQINPMLARHGKGAAPEEFSCSSGKMFIVDTSGGSLQRVVAVARTPHAFHILHSPMWTQLAREFSLAHEELLLAGELDAYFQRYTGHQHLACKRLIEEQDGCTLGYCDLTRKELPLPILLDPEQRVSMALSAGREPPAPRQTTRNVAFWGWSQDSRQKAFQVNEPERRVAIGELPQAVLQYPDLPQSDDIAIPQYPKPIPFAHFERWTLEELCSEHAFEFSATCDQEATRTAFLTRDWSDTDVLHISTHGHAVPDVPECSYLIVAEPGTLFAKLSFLDIMSVDFSAVRLVFLNACVSSVGQHRSGDAAISLAWAFRAAGASAVIATRWNVGDAVAWRFMDQFYRRWLPNGSRAGMRDAFRHAVRNLRNDHRFRCPHQWGTFVLLE